MSQSETQQPFALTPAIRVGLVGKRKIPADRIEAVALAVGSALDEIEAFVEHAPTPPAASAEPRLILIASLAPGADLLGARTALDRGWALHVVLPYPAEQFRTTYADEPGYATQFDEMLGRAESVFVMDFEKDPGLTKKAEFAGAYLAASQLTVLYADILIAVWDGATQISSGGTYQSMLTADVLKIPVISISSTSDGRGDRPFPRNLDHFVTELLRPAAPAWDASIPLAIQMDRGAGPSPAFAYRWACKILGAGAETQGDYSKRAAARTIPVPLPGDRTLRSIEAAADKLASGYAGWTRGTIALNTFLGALALTLGVGPGLLGLPDTIWSALMGIACSVVAVALYAWARYRSVHARWLAYRRLAEMLRSVAILLPIGASTRGLFRSDNPDWVDRYVAALIRQRGVLPAKLTPDVLRDYAAMLESLQRDQEINYHVPRAAQYSSIARRIRIFGFVAFGAMLAGTALQSGIVLADLLNRPLLPALQPIANLTVFMTIWGGALAAFAYQAEFSKLAQTSQILERRLAQLRKRTQAAESGRELRECAVQTVDVLMEEHSSWSFDTAQHEPDMPN